LLAVQAADVAARLHAETDGEVDLRVPPTALAWRPALLTELTEGVIQLQNSGRQFEAPGSIIWVHTLRAALMPELRPSVKKTWSLARRGGVPLRYGGSRTVREYDRTQAAPKQHYLPRRPRRF
jgi:hypothetical protein